jgi:mitochondrial fission protein ELM1
MKLKQTTSKRFRFYSFREFEGNYTAHFNYPGAEKVLVKFNESTNLQPGSAVLISRDKEGENLISLTMENNLKKDLSFYNIYGDNFYLHYPVYPSANYCLNVTEDSPSLQLLENPSLYKPLIRVYDQNNGKFVIFIDTLIHIVFNF